MSVALARDSPLLNSITDVPFIHSARGLIVLPMLDHTVPSMSAEKREHRRLKVRVPVELRPEISKSPIRTETADLSLSGLYVEIMFTLDLDTQLDIKLQLGESTVSAVGKVVTCDRTVRNGILFTRMLADDREELRKSLQAAET
jgi:hypothetical protein